MTLEILNGTIAKLIAKRQAAHGNEAEQERLNVKLSKLYECKYTMLAQQQKGAL